MNLPAWWNEFFAEPWAGSPERRVPVLEERSLNIETSRVESAWTIADDNGARSAVTLIRSYTYKELRALLEEADFVNVGVRDGKTGQAFHVGASRAFRG
jgi:hypothetical protein